MFSAKNEVLVPSPSRVGQHCDEADHISVPDHVLERWQQDAMDLAPQGNEPDSAFLDRATDVARKHTPLRIADRLRAVAGPDGPLYCVIKNLPIDDRLPTVPTDGRRPLEKKTWVSESVLTGLTRAIGLEVFTYRQEREGRWPQEVAPIAGRESGNHSGNREELGFHSDNAILASEHGAEYIALYALNNEHRTETWFVRGDDLLAELDRMSPEFVQLMRDPTQWQVPFPDSFEVGPDRPLSEPHAILTRGPHGEDHLSFALFNLRPVSTDAARAFKAIAKALDSETYEMHGRPSIIRTVVLAPRSLVLFSNTRGLHARGRIGGTRWAQRIYLRHSLDAIRDACGDPQGRVFDVRKLKHK